MAPSLPKWILSFPLVFLTACGGRVGPGAPGAGRQEAVGIIPRPAQITVIDGRFPIAAGTTVFIPPGDTGVRRVAGELAEIIKNAAGFAPAVEEVPATGGNPAESGRQDCFRFEIVGPSELGEEGYHLRVGPDAVRLAASRPAGFFYGVQTVRQLLPPESERRGDGAAARGPVSLPCLEITDRPAFGWRGLMLDCSRSFLPKSFLLRALDLLALYKLNVLHLHLTDDQGWRLEIKSHPELTEVCSKFSSRFPGETGGFYTQQEMKDIVAYAAARAIAVVPEIEMPGHSSEVFAAYPGLSCSGVRTEIFPFFQGPGVTPDIFCAGNEEVFKFLEDVLAEVVQIFPSAYIHIGGDEVPKDRWRSCPRCQARIRSEGLRDENELQGYFLRRIEKFLRTQGRELIGWDEILEGGLPSGGVVMSWRGTAGGVRAVTEGRKAVMSPTSHCYFDYDHETTPLKKVYSFDPVPDGLAPGQAALILGGQANMWTHIARTGPAIDRQVFPRLLALAEALWSEKRTKDFEDFRGRLESHVPRLEALGVGLGPDSGADRIWYRQPAKDWNEALPVGNGRLGAMVFGEPTAEIIQLNEETLWAGCPVNNNNPEALGNLPAVRRALFDGEYDAAAALAEKTMLGTPPRIRSYQPLGDLRLDFLPGRGPGPVLTSYERDVSLREGIAGAVFESGDGRRWTREVFASAVDDVIVVRLLGSPGAKVNVRLRLSREKGATTSTLSPGELVMTGQIVDPPDPRRGPAGNHMRFAARLAVLPDGGRIAVDQGASSLFIEGADAATLLIAAATDYDPQRLDFDRSIDPLGRCATVLDRARRYSPFELRARHVAEHSALFDRVRLDLGDDGSSIYPTDVRLERLKKGAEDPGLAALYFQFGRYLLMGSSRRPAVLPANLQGIWNKDFEAAWNSDFHTNINLQMNYWPAEVANLAETVAPLADFLRRLAVPGRVTARDMYGARGWTLHHLTDPFGRTGVADGVWGISPLAGPWLALTLWDHYEFTRDEKFLRDTAYPLLKGAAEFLTDFLVPSPEGWLVTAPSHSPENAFVDPATGKPALLTYGATIDIEIAAALIDSVIRASGILGVDRVFAARLAKLRKRLPPFRIGRHGNIQEWIRDFDEHEPGHRHMSHLLGLYPLALFTPENPELFEAAGETIARRLAHGGGQTGWSRAWIVCFYARLLDGERAGENLLALLRKSTLDNLFDTHPPFQIDGNFGGTAAIAEMLLQSHQGFIRLLPALPAAWRNGRAEGLIARGAFEVAMTWRDGKVERVEVLSKRGGRLRLANPFLGRGEDVRVEGSGVSADSLAKDFIEVDTRKGARLVLALR